MSRICKKPDCQHELKVHQRFYCSRSCSTSMRNRGIIQEPESRSCEHPDCETQLTYHQDRFCSGSCRSKILLKGKKRPNHPGFSEATRKKMSIAKKRNWKDTSYHAKQSKAIWDGGDHRAYNQKVQYVCGIKCYSQYEARYLRGLLEIGFILPARARSIKTPHGWYTADFDNGNEFIEIKCEYTLRGAFKNGQIKKIRWINSNMQKKVKIINLDRYDVFGIRRKRSVISKLNEL